MRRILKLVAVAILLSVTTLAAGPAHASVRTNILSTQCSDVAGGRLCIQVWGDEDSHHVVVWYDKIYGEPPAQMNLGYIGIYGDYHEDSPLTWVSVGQSISWDWSWNHPSFNGFYRPFFHERYPWSHYEYGSELDYEG